MTFRGQYMPEKLLPYLAPAYRVTKPLEWKIPAEAGTKSWKELSSEETQMRCLLGGV
jgi:hypothetical protein